MKDLLGCVGWAAVILFISVLIPVFGSFLSLLTPLPFLYYAAKVDLKEGVLLCAFSIMVVALAAGLVGLPQVIPTVIASGLVGIALSAFFRIRLGVGQTIFLSTAFLLLISLGHLWVLSLQKGSGLMEMVHQYLHTQLKASLEAYQKMGLNAESTVELETYGKTIINTVFPSLAIVGMGFVIWLNVVMAKPLFKMGGLKYPEFIQMDKWQAPENMIWGVIFSGFALFLFSGIIQFIAINVMIVLMAIYLFHGLSIILFFLNKYQLPSWVRAGVFFLIIIQQFFWLFLGLAGLFDQWIDFRKLKRGTTA